MEEWREHKIGYVQGESWRKWEMGRLGFDYWEKSALPSVSCLALCSLSRFVVFGCRVEDWLRTLIVDCVPNGNLNGSSSGPSRRIECPISGQGVMERALSMVEITFSFFYASHTPLLSLLLLLCPWTESGDNPTSE
jgi:hypothetical protein